MLSANFDKEDLGEASVSYAIRSEKENFFGSISLNSKDFKEI